MSRISWKLEVILIAIAAALFAAPDSAASLFRAPAADLLRPGLLAAQHVQQVLKSWSTRREAAVQQNYQSRLEQLEAQLAASQQALLRMETQTARGDTKTADLQPSEVYRPEGAGPERLIVPHIVRAAVLGKPLASLWRSGRLIDEGAQSDLRESALVLKSELPVVDVGQHQGLETEQLLLVGRTVLGKIVQVGRWSSTFQLVDDPEYRGQGQLIRQTSQGAVLGAKGIIQGTGEGTCELTGIDATELVEVGDRVYTAERDGIVPTPFYYGQVREATLGPDDREWHILVDIAPRPDPLTVVEVLIPQLNPDRFIAAPPDGEIVERR